MWGERAEKEPWRTPEKVRRPGVLKAPKGTGDSAGSVNTRLSDDFRPVLHLSLSLC